MSPQTAPQRTSSASSAQAALTLVADNDHGQPKPGWRFREARNSFAIAHAKKPIIFISEQSAKAYGRMAKYLMESFPTVPILFENDDAYADFMGMAGTYRNYAANQTIGVCEINKDFGAQPSSEFTAPDCIIVMGTPKPDMVMELNKLKDIGRSIIINQTAQRGEDYVPTAGVNIPQISEYMRKKDMNWDPQWVQQLKDMRPSLA